MNNLPNEHYLRLAKELTGSSDIDVVISSASKIAKYMNGSQVAQYHSMMRIEEFAKTCKISHPINGAIHFKPYDFQINILKELKAPGSVIINISRQMGMSTMLGVFALHECVTKPDQTIVLMASKFASALDHLDRIRFMLETGENQLWPKVVTLNKGMIVFDNGSRILAKVADSNSSKGLSISTLIAVDAAYYPFSKEKDLWISLMPTITLGGKIIMASTPNLDKGLFYNNWINDIGWRKLLCTWSEHPERDEAWANKYRDMLGPVNFTREYECSFISSDPAP